MVISRTPYRISFFGGGTDYPAWYRENGGAVLGTAIDKYCFITCRYLPPFFEHRLRLVYSKIEDCQSAADIQHPVVRNVLAMLRVERGLEIHHDGDLPARSGMGSSSAFTVGFLHAMYGLLGRLTSQRQLAAEAIHVEQDLIGETVGAQDQIFASFGGFNLIEFKRDDSFRVEPNTSKARLEELNGSLMLFYTGLRRTASEVAASYVTDIGARTKQLTRMREMVDEGMKILAGQDSLDAFGDLLDEAWQTQAQPQRCGFQHPGGRHFRRSPARWRPGWQAARRRWRRLCALLRPARLPPAGQGTLARFDLGAVPV